MRKVCLIAVAITALLAFASHAKVTDWRDATYETMSAAARAAKLFAITSGKSPDRIPCEHEDRRHVIDPAGSDVSCSASIGTTEFRVTYVVISDEKDVVLAFMGSATPGHPYYDANNDMNLNGLQVPFISFRHALVHKGWGFATEALLEGVAADLAAAGSGSKRVHVTGFSMGGALAGYLTFRLMDSHPGVFSERGVLLTTLAAPRFAGRLHTQRRAPFNDWFDEIARERGIDIRTVSVELVGDRTVTVWHERQPLTGRADRTGIPVDLRPEELGAEPINTGWWRNGQELYLHDINLYQQIIRQRATAGEPDWVPNVFRLRNAGSGRCVEAGTRGDGQAATRQAPCSKALAMFWIIEPSDAHDPSWTYLKNAASSKVMNVEFNLALPGHHVILWEKTRDNNEQWKIESSFYGYNVLWTRLGFLYCLDWRQVEEPLTIEAFSSWISGINANQHFDFLPVKKDEWARVRGGSN